MLGAMVDYITNEQTEKFQPMGANFGLLPALDVHIRDKKERYKALAEKALADLNALASVKELQE